MSERTAALRILAEQPEFKMRFFRLAQELTTRKALGFGVEVEHLVAHLEQEGLVTCNKTTDEVVLNAKNLINMFFDKQEKQS